MYLFLKVILFRGGNVYLFRNRLGMMVKDTRKTRGLTQEQLAEKVNVSTGMIGQIERGETMPSVETLAALILQLEIDPNTLFYGKQPKDSDYLELCILCAKMNKAQRQLLLGIAKVLWDASI